MIFSSTTSPSWEVTRSDPDTKYFCPHWDWHHPISSPHHSIDYVCKHIYIQASSGVQFTALTTPENVNTMAVSTNNAAKHISSCCPPPVPATILVDQGGMSNPNLILNNMSKFVLMAPNMPVTPHLKRQTHTVKQ